MKQLLLLSYFSFLISYFVLSGVEGFPQVGIGTKTPNNKAILDIQSTSKGILFPRLTSTQRNGINNPPNGLHIFNTDERCLNYYDSVYQTWNCYCENDTCKVVTISINNSGCGINFYNQFAINFPVAKKYVVVINPGVTINGCTGSGDGLTFNSFPFDASIKIINHGSIYGAGGKGGEGATGQVGSCSRAANPGGTGGHAITTRLGVLLSIENHGLIAGGGGGGGGGGRSAAGEYGGGGGGGAGIVSAGGGGGGSTISGPFGSCGTVSSIAQSGAAGEPLSAGSGGTGANGGGNGGIGGTNAQVGQNGTGNAAGIGGSGGKAISGGSGNILINRAGGQTFGAID